MKRNQAALLVIIAIMAIIGSSLFVSSRYADTWPADETEVELIVKMFPTPLTLPCESLPRLNPAITPVIEKVNLRRKVTSWKEYVKLNTPESIIATWGAGFGEKEWGERHKSLEKRKDTYVHAVVLLRSKSTSRAFVFDSPRASIEDFQIMQGDAVICLIQNGRSEWLIDNTLKTTQLANYFQLDSYVTRYLLTQDREGFARKVPDIKRRYRQEFILHDPERVILTTRDTGIPHIKGDTP